MASFLLVGCEPVNSVTPPVNDVVTEATVDIDGAVVLDGKTYVSAGAHDITVTFPAPVTNVTVFIGLCGGDYSKGLLEDIIAAGGLSVVMWSNADGTIWTGSGDFYGVGLFAYGCCASYVFVTSGDCEDEVCIQFPVIVDSDDPFALIKVTSDDCTCDDCSLTFKSITEPDPCLPDVECCGDDCSGLYNWSITIYDEDPFGICCDVPCATPVDSSSGPCPIDWTTKCLKPGYYWVVITLVDHVGNVEEYYAKINIGAWPDCILSIYEFYADLCGLNDCDCTDWVALVDTDEYIGYCEPTNNCAPCPKPGAVAGP